jgi:hypothetical protein
LGEVVREGFLEVVAFELIHEKWTRFQQEILEKMGRKGFPGRRNSRLKAPGVGERVCWEETLEYLPLS